MRNEEREVHVAALLGVLDMLLIDDDVDVVLVTHTRLNLCLVVIITCRQVCEN